MKLLTPVAPELCFDADAPDERKSIDATASIDASKPRDFIVVLTYKNATAREAMRSNP